MTTTTREKRNQVIAPRRHRRLHRQLFPVPPLPRSNRKQRQTQPKGLHACLQKRYLLLPAMNPIMKQSLLTMPPHPPLKNRIIHPLHAVRPPREVTASCRPSRPLRHPHGRSRRYLIVRRCDSSFRISGRTSNGKKTRCTLSSLRRRTNASTM